MITFSKMGLIFKFYTQKLYGYKISAKSEKLLNFAIFACFAPALLFGVESRQIVPKHKGLKKVPATNFPWG